MEMSTASVAPETVDVFDEDELTALALSADPDAPIPADAVSLWDLEARDSLLPEWYMPAPMSGRRLSGWQRRVAWVVVAAFVLIDAWGLCSTYGSIVLA
jgi:hypothetical protein